MATEYPGTNMHAARGWYIVTGANAGIGRALALGLARKGLPVIMACRDLKRSEPVREAIVKQTGNPQVELLHLDLDSLRSAEYFAELIRERGWTIEALVNNAGTMCGEFTLTADHLERDIQVNYVGPYLLSRLLLPAMRPGSRIINTLSCTYRIGHLDKEVLNPDPAGFTRFGTYARSKLALLLFTLELAEKVRGAGIEVYAADPGVVSTGMIRMDRWFDPLADLLFRPLIRTPEKGARTALWLVLGGAGNTTARQVKSAENGNGPAPETVTDSVAREMFQKQENQSVYYYNRKPKYLPESIVRHPCRKLLWEETQRRIEEILGYDLPGTPFPTGQDDTR